MKAKIEIRSCYCEIPRPRLVELVRLRYVEGIDTQTLMSRIRSEKEREYLAAVALLDVKESDLRELVDFKGGADLHHLLCCRARAREILEHEGFVIEEVPR